MGKKSVTNSVTGGTVKNTKGMGTKGTMNDKAGNGIKGMEGSTTEAVTKSNSTYNDHDADDQVSNTKNKSMY